MFENIENHPEDQILQEEADVVNVPTEESPDDVMQRMPAVSVKLALHPNTSIKLSER